MTPAGSRPLCFAAIGVLMLAAMACGGSSDTAIPTPPPSARSRTPVRTVTVADATPGQVVRTIFEAVSAGDRAAAEAVASDRVVGALFDPLPEGSSPWAASLGDGPKPCIQAGHSYVCYFRDSTVKIFVRQVGPQRYFASWAMMPLGCGDCL